MDQAERPRMGKGVPFWSCRYRPLLEITRGNGEMTVAASLLPPPPPPQAANPRHSPTIKQTNNGARNSPLDRNMITSLTTCAQRYNLFFLMVPANWIISARTAQWTM